MILAEKILTLRKNSGWSQEELAEKMNVSRQSVSKWESAAAIPDINKILDLAKLFGVTTDYLLKDDAEIPTYTGSDDLGSRIRVSLQETADYLAARKVYGRKVALGASICVLSPVPLILLAGLSESGTALSENAAAGIGVTILLLVVAAAVSLFLISSADMRRFDYLRRSEFELEYGVAGILREKRAAFEKGYLRSTVTGVILCILCAVPLILAGIIGAPDILYIALAALLLVLVSAAVYLFASVGMVKSGYDHLLQEGEYSPEYMRSSKKRLGGIYWPIVTAVYLAWSFLDNSWDISWLIWPVAALVFAGISAIVREEK